MLGADTPSATPPTSVIGPPSSAAISSEYGCASASAACAGKSVTSPSISIRYDVP